ncbi:MAG: hypothetical protein IIU46_10040 [Treponema sp.]|nr:hypothetical protein [Treponema sp.]
MIQNIAKGYKKFISLVGKIILLSALCVLLGVCIVFPLWKWASSTPAVYSYAILALVAAGAVYLFISLFRKKGALRFFMGFLKIAFIIGGLSLCVYFVLQSNRTAALIVLIVSFVLYGILSAVSASVLGRRKVS